MKKSKQTNIDSRFVQESDRIQVQKIVSITFSKYIEHYLFTEFNVINNLFNVPSIGHTSHVLMIIC